MPADKAKIRETYKEARKLDKAADAILKESGKAYDKIFTSVEASAEAKHWNGVWKRLEAEGHALRGQAWKLYDQVERMRKEPNPKKPSAAQLAARKKFAAAAKARSVAAKAKKTKKNPTYKKGQRVSIKTKQGSLSGAILRKRDLPFNSEFGGHQYVVKLDSGKTETFSGFGMRAIRTPARRRNKTVIVKPKRVLVVNGKKRVAKKATKRKRNKTIITKPKRVLVVNGKPKASPKVRKLREQFVGTPSRKTAVMHVPNGTPTNLAKLGRLVSIKLKGKTINPASGQTMWLCSDARGKLHLASPKPWPVQNPKVKQNFGEVMELEYATPKPHLGFKKNTIFFHKMGEEGGKRPKLITDGQYLRFQGGSYKISPEGIRN